MKYVWMFGLSVMFTAVVGGVWAQHDVPQVLTPEIIYTSEVTNIEAGEASIQVVNQRVSSVEMCELRDCLTYQASSPDVHFVDISSTPEIYKTVVWNDPYAWDPVFSPDDTLAILSPYEGPAYIWNIETEERVFDIGSGWYGAYWNESGTQFVARSSENRMTGFWDAVTGEMLFEMPDWAFWIEDESLILSYDAEDSPLLRIYDPSTGAEIGQIDYGSPIWTLALNTENHDIVLAGEDVSLWNLDTQQKIFTFLDNTPDDLPDYNILFDYAQDGSAIVTRDEGVWTVWNTADQTIRFTLPQTNEEEFFRPYWNKASTYLLVNYRSPYGCEENCAYGSYIWDAQTGEITAKIDALANGNTFWTTNDRYVISELDEHTFLIWDAQTGAKLFELPHPEPILYEEWEFNHDGSKLVVWTEKQIYLWTIPQL